MSEQPAASLKAHFGSLEDPREGPALRHKLIDIVVIAICGVIGGADSWVEIEEFGKAKLSWWQQFLELPNGMPSHDTFGRVFRRLDPAQFQARFLAWVQAVFEVSEGQVLALDGKPLRRSHDTRLGRPRSIWSVPGRARIGWCWARSQWTTRRMRSQPCPRCWKCWR